MKYELTLTASLMENVVSLKPIYELNDPKADFSFIFNLRCENCGMVMDGKSMRSDKTRPILGYGGRRRRVHLVEKCTKCSRLGTISIIPLNTDKTVTAAKPSAMLTVFEIDGLIPFDFKLSGPVWQISDVDGRTYDHIDLEDGWWFDDEDVEIGGVPATLNITTEMEHLKVKLN